MATVTDLLFLKGKNGVSKGVLALQDTDGNLAVPTTEFVQLPSGLLIPRPVDANGNPLAVLTGSILPQPVKIQDGTVSFNAVATGATAGIIEPSTRYSHLVFAYNNETGQNISSLAIVAQNAVIDGVTINEYFIENYLPGDTSPSTGAACLGVDDRNGGDNFPYLWFLGVPIVVNIAIAASATGNIYWALYGY